MNRFPPVSAMCLTYGRPHLLEEAIQSFLLQDYSGPKELVILNDFVDQTLVCEHSEVHIINTAQRFPTVGEKRNACVTLARHDILFVWNDEDLCLPWRLNLSVRRLENSRGYYTCPQAWILSNGGLDGPATNRFHGAACFTRELFEKAGRYPHIGSREDWGLEEAIERLIPDEDHLSLSMEDIYYVHRWPGAGSYHPSDSRCDDGPPAPEHDKVTEFVAGQDPEGKISTGVVRLKPAWHEDYLGKVRLKVGMPTAPAFIVLPTQPSTSQVSSITQLKSEPFAGLSQTAANSSPVSLASPSPTRLHSGVPLVSCVMPTYGRPDYVAESIAMFLAQDYPAKELIILNDCAGQKLLGEFPGVRIVNADARWPTLGEKRNAVLELAHGEYIAVWDDDDIYFPWRLSHGMQRIHELQIPLYCPAEYWAYWGSEDLHENQAQLNWIYHPLVIFRKELWQAVGGYPAQTLSEDTAFFKKVLEHLGTDWPRDPIGRHERVMIMRAKSKYAHTSISGGSGEPDTQPREIILKPGPISDLTLRRASDRLMERRTRNAVRRLSSHNAVDSLRRSLPDANEIWLDRLSPQSVSVGFGEAGFRGSLGYEWKLVEINGEPMPHAISAHASSRLVYELEGRFQEFRSRVALNDTALDDATSADFYVLADGVIAGVAQNVCPGQIPRLISADVQGVRRLELLVQTRRWSWCHSVWADPVLISGQSAQAPRVLVDGLERAEIVYPPELPPAKLCIATVGSKGYEGWIDNLFGSICANAQCTDALLAVFSLGDSIEIRSVAEKYGAVVIPCRPLRPLNVSSKSVLYAAGHVLRADKFICLDADMLVLDDLRPIVAMIDAAPFGAILTCREANWARDLEQAVMSIYGGHPDDISFLVGDEALPERRYSFIVNDGIFAGSRAALRALDYHVRCLNQPIRWVDDPIINKPWRNQFIFNLVLAQTDCGVELGSRYNVQLQSQRAEFRADSSGITADTHGLSAAIVHFNGGSRNHAGEWRGRYGAIRRPLTRTHRGSDGYEAFLAALRKWIGQLGQDALTWSFYGTTDGQSAQINDASAFPLLATLHYLIRSNGCSRVIETGTARGVSAACLASAVAHRTAAAVVTIDVNVFSERELLWSMLPTQFHECIRPRQNDAIEGLRAALAEGETYHAALLDSVHTAEHVLQEFEIARQLVCGGGLILIHDAILKTGSVAQALDEIQHQGYGVTRLWTAEAGGQEDDFLGLAVIENRCRKM